MATVLPLPLLLFLRATTTHPGLFRLRPSFVGRTIVVVVLPLDDTFFGVRG